MLTFRNTNIAVLAILSGMLIASQWVHLPFYWFLLLLIVYSVVLFLGSAYIGSNFYFPVICSAGTTEKKIAISFDDGPLPRFTPEILAILRTHQVPAAFFCIGKRVQEHPELLQQLLSEGHIVGNHSYSHDHWFDLFSAAKMKADLQQMNEQVENLTGLSPRLFRPPYGVTNPNLKKAVMSGSYVPVGWNIRSLDTVARDPHKLLQRVTGLLKPGAVVLFHDTVPVTASMLTDFIVSARGQGYEIVRLDKLLKLEPYA